MLLEIRIANFRSIAEEQVFSMLPSMQSSRTHDTQSHFYPQALKVAVIYGANGSGKSTFIMALQLLDFLITKSGGFNSSRKLPSDKHIFYKELDSSPTSIEITFTAWGDVWRYGIAIEPTHIAREFLYKRNSAKRSKEKMIFEREGQSIKLHGDLSSYENVLKEQTNPNQLAISKLDQNNDKVTQPAYKWLHYYLRSIRHLSNFHHHTTVDMCNSGNATKNIVDFMKGASIQLDDIIIDEKKLDWSPARLEALKTLMEIEDGDLEDTPVDHDIKFTRRDRDGDLKSLDFMDESRGTRELFSIAGPIIDTLKHGFTLIIDEMNQSFHTELQQHIVDLFLSIETNPKGAQLIFTTHDTNIMNSLERDEIWLVEKQQNGATQYLSVSDFGAVKDGGDRKNAAFEKRYLEGRYGALPNIDFIESASAIRKMQDVD